VGDLAAAQQLQRVVHVRQQLLVRQGPQIDRVQGGGVTAELLPRPRPLLDQPLRQPVAQRLVDPLGAPPQRWGDPHGHPHHPPRRWLAVLAPERDRAGVDLAAERPLQDPLHRQPPGVEHRRQVVLDGGQVHRRAEWRQRHRIVLLVLLPGSFGRRDDLRRARQRRDRPGLDQEQLALGDGPLDVLGLAERRLDRRCERADARGVLGVDGPLGAGHPASLAVPDPPLVRGGRTAHQPLAQAPNRAHQDLVAVAGDRVGGEGDPSRLGGDHGLDQDRHAGAGKVRVPEPPGGVRGDPLRAGRRRAPHDRLGDRVEAVDAEEGLVLPGEGRAGQVLCQA
jgi:hypothetical protein